ncbi:cysteine--tRNA ligase [Candidatus Woesearchaeota archaeon]|jgi:cysteinyl-tRNA synthetase|nr:cysteine--tRNA ligase [Candidatus Woesearchaeota archaeon]MBT7237904.1 cysteine--tRNA ligase [Candidatus Woesearchaeota archaeon]
MKIYNTLSRKLEEFKPIKKNEAGVYSCGPTVYWYQHIGNLRTYIFSDILRRVLEHNKFKVKQIMNVTDVGHLTSDADEGEDKMEKAAKKEGKKAKDIANYYLKIFKEDFKKLNIQSPTKWTKASEHIKEQIELIKKLEEKKFTYKTSDGIYFDTSKFPNYAKFAKLNIEKLEAGKRVEIREKKNKTDFALWKFSPKNEKRQQEWKSPWGIGFPGWHIECSAMSMKYLGENFDIHTGGEDHITIHHTNEIAQSEASTDKKFVNYWVHGAFLLSKGKKVSKSKGGLYTISELEELNYNPLDFRYLCLTTKYRVPLNFTLEALDSAKNSLEKIKNKIQELNDTSKGNIKKYQKEFLESINQDLNMPKALAVLQEVIKTNKLGGKEKLSLIKEFDKILALDLTKIKKEIIPKEIKELVKEREKARKKKKWELSDKLRNKINSLGYDVKDTKEGQKLKILK